MKALHFSPKWDGKPECNLCGTAREEIKSTSKESETTGEIAANQISEKLAGK